MTLKAEKFEELLATELSSALEPQRGKAVAAFRAHVAQERLEAANPRQADKAIAGKIRPRQASRLEVLFWTSVPSLAAACLAVVVTLKLMTPGAGVGGTMTASTKGKLIVSPQVEQTEVVSSQDGGVLVNNNTPMRVIREQTTKTTQWIDPNDHSVYKLTEPGESVNYQRVQPF